MTFPVNQMPLGRAVWTLIMLASVGVIGIVGVGGWLLFIWIAQHVRFV